MTINDMLADILSKEGGFVNHPDDKGGATNFGITHKTLSGYLNKTVSVDDVKSLKIETAKEIYKKQYYQQPKIDRLPTELQPFLFDAAVNHGSRRAIKFLQNVCNQYNFGPIDSDGLVGPNTCKKATACYTALNDWMMVALVEERQKFYVDIVDRNPRQSVFLKGWFHRAKSFMPDIPR